MKRHNRSKSVTYKSILALLLAVSLVTANIGMDTFAAGSGQTGTKQSDASNSMSSYDEVIDKGTVPMPLS